MLQDSWIQKKHLDKAHILYPITTIMIIINHKHKIYIYIHDNDNNAFSWEGQIPGFLVRLCVCMCISCMLSREFYFRSPHKRRRRSFDKGIKRHLPVTTAVFSTKSYSFPQTLWPFLPTNQWDTLWKTTYVLFQMPVKTKKFPPKCWCSFKVLPNKIELKQKLFMVALIKTHLIIMKGVFLLSSSTSDRLSCGFRLPLENVPLSVDPHRYCSEPLASLSPLDR